jgi:hypothetical protein
MLKDSLLKGKQKIVMEEEIEMIEFNYHPKLSHELKL